MDPGTFLLSILCIHSSGSCPGWALRTTRCPALLMKLKCSSWALLLVSYFRVGLSSGALPGLECGHCSSLYGFPWTSSTTHVDWSSKIISHQLLLETRNVICIQCEHMITLLNMYSLHENMYKHTHMNCIWSLFILASFTLLRNRIHENYYINIVHGIKFISFSCNWFQPTVERSKYKASNEWKFIYI